MGKLISFNEKIIRKILSKDKKGELLGGFFTVFFTIAQSLLIFGTIRYFLYKLNFYLGFAYDIFLSSQMLAANCLKKAGMEVYFALKVSLDKGRKAVSMIVGRDTENLKKDEVIKAAVETVAENTGDGEVSPMFYLFLFGPLGAVAYKAINTMDSMLGYKNEKYIYFGYAAAKLDDAANFIPARIAALLMIISSFILKFDGKSAYKIFLRDRNKHKSPNSGQLESVCAGSLGVMLGGDSCYFGKLSKKATLGDNIREIEEEDIIKTCRLLYMTSFLAFLCFFIILIIL